VAEIQGGEAARIDPTDNRSPRYDVYTTNEACPELLNWYLLFPMLSIDGTDGVAIQLFHGAAVGWDGRHVRHCTTVQRTGTGRGWWTFVRRQRTKTKATPPPPSSRGAPRSALWRARLNELDGRIIECTRACWA
jgi:hypothetical protein